MKRCTHCFRYSVGDPTYCNHCGRSFNVRICARGHINARGATFCAECGSGDLSTPAPPAPFLFHLTQWVLRVMGTVAVVIVAGTAVLGLLYSLDWSAIAPRLVLLGLMLAFLYWTTTLVPGRIKKVGKAVGKHVVQAMSKKRKSK